MLDGKTWEDPLSPKAMTKNSWPYGPYFNRGTVIPIASLLDEKQDAGMSWVVSPENTLLDSTLSTTAAGEIAFRFASHRLGKGQVVRLAMDLVRHEADWRGGMRWMTGRYQPFFDPPNPKAHQIGGCGSYSGWYKDLDYSPGRRWGSVTAGRLRSLALPRHVRRRSATRKPGCRRGGGNGPPTDGPTRRRSR